MGTWRNIQRQSRAAGARYPERATGELDAALKAIASGKIKTACSALSDFINQVKAQRGKAISAATADEWILEAMRLRTALGC
jgi:hypothetical protein